MGIPSGVTGTPLIVLHVPVMRYSASAAGVTIVSSGVAPAIVTPGIKLTSVVPMTRRKEGLFVLILSDKLPKRLTSMI
ncbi:conserved hypothetical protein [Metallosphaera cuprina Ar-4]|uniref:Uncharacterized protein n=1 Tax=Metallosphaera cuprina (strain Ar-4) TaxID=1006006 RepID=F4FY92_METCR|nr:conserved hypothetical protein [Metallosphaera cuprina Ar-4]